MTNDTLADIDELQRIPAPGPEPMTLACDGTDIWVASAETNRLYGLRATTAAVFEEAVAPGSPIGATVTGDALRIVISDDDTDSRTIRRYVFGHGFKTEAIPCPDDSGSFLAYDGDSLFLSQRFALRILEMDDDAKVRRAIAVPRQICGMTIVGGRFFLMTTADRDEPDDYRLLRLDARGAEPIVTELARIPFVARSLAWDGTKFWTNARRQNEIVAFAPVGV
jgi:hypothetical protein